MAHDVHIHVSFEAYAHDDDEVAAAAVRCMATLAGAHPQSEEGRAKLDECRPREVLDFLTYLAAGRRSFDGPKGSLYLWGYVGNYTDAAQFVDVLRPFWVEMLKPDGPAEGNHIVVIYEHEQSERAYALEIYFDDHSSPYLSRGQARVHPPAGDGLVVLEHWLPFAFMQM